MTNIAHPAASQPSKETSGAFPLTEKLSLQLSGVDDCCKAYPLPLKDTTLCLTMIFIKQDTCMLKIIMTLPWERFSV